MKVYVVNNGRKFKLFRRKKDAEAYLDRFYDRSSGWWEYSVAKVHKGTSTPAEQEGTLEALEKS